MFSRRIFVTAFAFFMVTFNTACPRDLANDIIETDKLTTEYNEKVDKANALSLDLMNSNIFLSIGPLSKSSIWGVTWASVSVADRATIRTKLNTYLSLIGRIIELSNHKAVKERVTDTSRQLQREHQQAARDYLDALNTYEKK